MTVMLNNIEKLRRDFGDLSDLSKLTIADNRGRPAVKIGYVLKLYFKDAHLSEERSAQLDVLERYADEFGEKITHYMPYEGTRLRRASGVESLSQIRAHLASLAPDDHEGFDAELYGFPAGEDEDAPTPIHIGLVSGPAIDRMRLSDSDNALGRIEAYFPADWRRGDYDGIVRTIIDWAQASKPIHGTFGLGLIMEEGGGRGSDTSVAWPLLKRFPGLDYPDLSLWLVRSESASAPVVRGINWLTMIDDRRALMLGGAAKIAEALGPSCVVERYDGGIVVRAGREPALGDMNRGDIPSAYRSAARVVKPLRFAGFRKHGLFRGLPHGLDDKSETLDWLARFD
jgi:hypothetical protein